jgi:iron complex outermembrane receptor protein
MSRQQIRSILCVCALATAFGAQVFGQGSVTVTGQVSLENGDAVHGATVIIVGARRRATTDDKGTFTIADVAPGSYEVIALREHFAAARQTIVVGQAAPSPLAFVLKLETLHEEVSVTASATGDATAFEAFSSVKSLDSIELAENRGATLTDALAAVPGVSVRSFGSGSARPIIRGFDGDRVLVMQDGVRTGDLSSQSADHGVSIDPASLERVEVVKGPATLLYGSNALGGVVNAITPQDAFRTAPFAGVVGGLSVDGGSANAQGGASGNVQYGRGPWMVWAGGGSRRTGDYDTPIGPVANSGTRLSQGSGGVGWAGNRAFWSVGGQIERSRFGIPFAGLFHHHEGEEEPEGEEHALEVDIEADRRVLRADAGLHRLQGSWLDAAKLTFNYTDYAHDEIEIEDGQESLGTAFSNTTSSLRAELEQKRRGRLSGRMGVDWFGRDYTAAGEEALAPPTTQSAISAFLYEELNFGRWRTQFGGRIERNAYQVGERPPHEDEEGEEEHEPPAARDRTFVGASASAGLHADIGTSGAFVVNVSTAARAPALEELYNFGPHVGNLAFEVGNPDLELERTVGLDVSLRSRAERVRGELSAYVYRIRNFVFLDFTGEVEHGLREAEFLQGDSRFAGVEASVNVDLAGRARLLGTLAAVNAKLTDTNEFLPRIPPVSGRVELEVPWRGLTINPEVVVTARQGNVFRDEMATAGSTVVNLGASYFVIRGHATHALTFKAYNLTNEDYRLHTSFIKDLALEMGRGIRVSYSVKMF